MYGTEVTRQSEAQAVQISVNVRYSQLHYGIMCALKDCSRRIDSPDHAHGRFRKANSS